ncbi:hypothetical protein ACFIOY_39070 [Bradyrhizobium sp. TZ2]
MKIRKAVDQRLSLRTVLVHPFFASLLAQQLAKHGAGGEAIAILADAAQTERTGEGWVAARNVPDDGRPLQNGRLEW